MFMSRVRECSLLVTLLMLTVSVGGAEELPSAEKLLDRYTQASGGAEAFADVETRVTTGRMEISGTGIGGELKTWEARPDRFLMEFSAEGLGRVLSGSDGKTVWEVSDIQGARILEGAERAFALRTSQMDATLRWRELYARYETVEQKTVNDSTCFAVTMTPHVGNPETWCLSTDSGLPLTMEMVASTAMGDIPVVIEFSDYRAVDGITVPFRTVQRLMMQEMVTTLDSVEHNVKLDASRFELPEEIVALLADGDEQEATEAASDNGSDEAITGDPESE